MIASEIKEFVETIRVGLVASADKAGVPHIAAGTYLSVKDEFYLMFDNWFCETTLQNVKENPKVAVGVTSPDLQKGYLFIGTMTRAYDEPILNGFVPEVEKPGMPQALVRMIVRVGKVMEFSSGIHTDLALA